jgi:glycosyltransferase involved in cell wall biosynthesis
MGQDEKIRLAYVVPTKDHPADLRKMLTSLQGQTRLPDQVVVVDGSDPDIEYICGEFKSLPITYVCCYPPSLAKQRNAGMRALSIDISVAGYLDDDLVLKPDATERMAAFWQSADADVGGASFSIVNQPSIHREWTLRLFMMHGDPPGRVLASGFPCYIPFVEETIETEWLYGGATLWRRAIIRKYEYDEWYIGHGFLEDLDYSYRVSREKKLFVVGDARTWHFSAPMSQARQYELGRQQTFNRLYFVRKLGTFNSFAVAWALFGTVLLNVLAVIRRPNWPTVQRLRGNLVGILAALFGRTRSFAGFWK